jgi:hypothetical protein
MGCEGEIRNEIGYWLIGMGTTNWLAEVTAWLEVGVDDDSWDVMIMIIAAALVGVEGVAINSVSINRSINQIIMAWSGYY